MHLHEYMGWPGPVTHRQHLAWREWLESQWNAPSRSDYYVMQLTSDVRSIFAKNPSSVTTEKCKIEFRREGENPKGQGGKPGMTKELATAYAKARLGLMLTAATDGKFNVPRGEPMFAGGRRGG
jgi:hypothetical protein